MAFFHHLLQEYFAARKLAAHLNPRLVRQEWRADRVKPDLDETLGQLSDADPLPPLKATGWEETARLAAGMAAELSLEEPKPEDAGGFVRALSRVNLPLAAACAAEPEAHVSEALTQELRQGLIERARSEEADLRARIEAGRALGDLGDPRFERKRGRDGDFLLPPLVKIPAGTYPIGSKDGDDDEKPVHKVVLAEFEMGRFPVTNAEWRLFMEAGGYEDQQWWASDEDRAWQRGDATDEGPKERFRDARRFYQRDPEALRRFLREGRVTSVYVEAWEGYLRMSDEEFESLLAKEFPGGILRQPQQWNDQSFNHPSQPVVGVSWHEARAYCAWLSARSGQRFRLPTEVEWEAAARGTAGRVYAYGDRFDVRRANTFESHIRRTTPVGIYGQGETPEGICDLTGNVWEWTSILYRNYPYKAEDGREAETTGEGRRVVRGGAWINCRDFARAAFRRDGPPGSRGSLFGFRVVRVSPIFE